MEKMTWTGSFGNFMDPVFQAVAVVFLIAVALQLVGSFVLAPVEDQIHKDGTITRDRGPNALIGLGMRYSLLALIVVVVIYIVAGVVTPLGTVGIIGALAAQLAPVWLALIVTFLLSIVYKRRLGLYGKLFDSTIGIHPTAAEEFVTMREPWTED